MPEISRFFGIVIFMNYNDHEPPHFKPKFCNWTQINLARPLAATKKVVFGL